MAQIIVVLLIFFIHPNRLLFSGLVRLALELTPSLFSIPQKGALPNLRPVILKAVFF